MRTKTSTPVRIEASLYEEATAVAPLMSRSVAQQITHWARLGRELEASADLSVSDVARTLAAGRHYDSLGPEEQAVVRAHWNERIDQLTNNLRLDEKFSQQGRPWVELDDEGNVVRREPEISADGE